MNKLALILIAIVLGGCAQNKEEKIAAENVPMQVMNPVKARLPGVSVTRVTRETENNAVIYDFELVQQGRKFEMDVKEDGTVTEIEKQIMPADIPAAVTKIVKDKYPQATIGEVMEVDMVNGSQETPDHYEVTLTNKGEEMEVNVSMDGSKIEEVKE